MIVAPTTAAIAPTTKATSTPLMNALRAARASSAPVSTADAPRYGELRRLRIPGSLFVLSMKRDGVERRGEPTLIARRQCASDHGDAERAANLECHGIARRTNPGISLRERADHRVRCRG